MLSQVSLTLPNSSIEQNNDILSRLECNHIFAGITANYFMLLSVMNEIQNYLLKNNVRLKLFSSDSYFFVVSFNQNRISVSVYFFT